MNNSFKTLGRLLTYVAQHKYRVGLGVLTIILMGLADTIVSGGTAIVIKILSELSSAKTTINNLHIEYNFWKFSIAIDNFNYIFYIAITVFFVVVFKGIVQYFFEYLMNSTAYKVSLRIKKEIFEKVVKLPMRYFDTEKTGGITSRITVDVGNLDTVLNYCIAFTQNLINITIFITALFIVSWRLSLFILLVFPIAVLIVKQFSTRIKNIARNVSINLADITSFLQEKVSGIKIVKSYVREKYEAERFGKIAKENYALWIKYLRLQALLNPVNEVYNTALMVVIILFCGYQFAHKQMTIDIMAQFVILVTMVTKPIKAITDNVSIISRSIASAQRIFELLEDKEEIVVHKESSDISSISNKIEFRDVNFSYNSDIQVIKNFNLDVNCGQTIAFVGESGGGKSTIMNLLPRFYEIQSGAIKIDDVDIRQIPINVLRKMMAIVPQDTILFADTIIENIRYGKLDASDEEVYKAAQMANAHNFIEQQPNGYNTYIGERGVQLSGGQRQRIAIARAILSNPQILLLDEATSALDTESEKLVQEALERLMENRTSFVVAHRLSTIQKADKIVVIEKGEIVETGNHESLLSQNGVYSKLYNMQFKNKNA